MPQHEKLRSLMDQHGIGAEEVSEILGVKVTTVHQWRTKAGSNISDNNLKLLELHLTTRSEQ